MISVPSVLIFTFTHYDSLLKNPVSVELEELPSKPQEASLQDRQRLKRQSTNNTQCQHPQWAYERNCIMPVNVSWSGVMGTVGFNVFGAWPIQELSERCAPFLAVSFIRLEKQLHWIQKVAINTGIALSKLIEIQPSPPSTMPNRWTFEFDLNRSFHQTLNWFEQQWTII